MDLPHRIFVSPHPDDIAYSCYSSVTNPPSPILNVSLILTVFSVSQSAAGLKGHKSPEAITRIRKAEDERFALSEGCRLVSLDFGDSKVRNERNEGLAVSLDDSSRHTIFKDVKSAIAKIIKPSIGKACIYIPLGIRGDIDHRLVRDFVREIMEESGIPGALTSLIYYEDLPYAAFTFEHEIRSLAKRLISPKPRSFEASLKGIWDRKKKAVEIYSSQLTPIVMKAIADHSSNLGGSELPEAERLWVQDSSGKPPVVDIIAWVTWEAARRVGGYTTLLHRIFASPKFQSVVGRTILMGPMYMPLICPEYDPLEDIQAIASTMNASILYPIAIATAPSRLSKRICSFLGDIENRHGVSIFYLRDKDQTHQVDRVLFNFSRALDQENVYMKTLPTLLTDLKNHINLVADININQRPSLSEVLSDMKDWTGFDPYDNKGENLWKKSRCDVDPSFYAHQDSDSVYGMLLALPVSECLRGLTEVDESAALIATEELSLPAVYATQIAREKYSREIGPNIKTIFYSGDVHPVRNLTTGAVLPKVPSLDTVGGFDFEGPIRSLIRLSLQDATADDNDMPILIRYFLDFEPLSDISTHTNMRIMQQAWRVDAMAATSASVRDELAFLNRCFALQGEIPIISPGVTVISCDPEGKELCRKKLISYARWAWNIKGLTPQNTIIASQIARAVKPKGFVRAVRLLHALSALMSEGDKKTNILFIIVTSWGEGRTNVGDYRIIDELLQELGGTILSTGTLHVKVVNQPRWPLVPESNQLATGLTREDLHRATDLSLCLSLYDTFAIAPLEPMSCGSVAVVSTGCGCYRKVLEIDGWKENIIVADYSEEWVNNILSGNHGNITPTLDSIFKITREQREGCELSTHKKVSQQLVQLLPQTTEQRAEKIKSGRRVAQALNWEDQFSAPFELLIRSLFLS